MIIDTHCHLSKKDYDDIDQVIKNMNNNIMIVSGASPEDNKEVIELVNKYDNIYGTLGLHPEYADIYTNEDLKFIKQNISNSKIVGIGEIGLDYHYSKQNKQNQAKLFKEQIKIANKNKKTIVIHSRDAMFDTYNILKENNKNSKCIMHCFSGSLETAQKLITMNIKLGIGGVLTFKNEKKLKQIVKQINLDNFVLETDSPYLAPEPYRGTKNEPKNVILVAQKISEIKNIPLCDVIIATNQTAKAQFDLNIDV